MPLRQSMAWHVTVTLLHTGGMDVLVRGDVILMDLKTREAWICFCLAKNGVNFLTSQCVLYQFRGSKQGANKRVIFIELAVFMY